DHQHGVVRRDRRRGHRADRLHGEQGRCAGDDARDRSGLREAGHPRERAVPGARRHAAAPAAARRPCGALAPARARADGPARPGGRDRARGAVPRLGGVVLRERRDVPRRRRDHRSLRDGGIGRPFISPGDRRRARAARSPMPHGSESRGSGCWHDADRAHSVVSPDPAVRSAADRRARRRGQRDVGAGVEVRERGSRRRLRRQRVRSGPNYDAEEAVSEEYELVKYRPHHKPMVPDLQRELLSSDSRLNTRYLEWKYERTPDPRDAFIYLAVHQGKPVGMRGFHEATLEAGTPTRAFSVLIAGDALISTAHRNRGLVSRIMRAAETDQAVSGYPYFVSIGGANRVNMFGLRSLGWRSAGHVHPVGRITVRARAGYWLSGALSRQRVLWRFDWRRLLASADQRDPFRHLDASRTDRGPGNRLPIAVESRPRLD